MTEVLFLLPVRSQPRYHKRIRGLQRCGIEARALYFERPYFQGAVPPCAAHSIGKIRHGAYLSRLAQLAAALRPVRRAAREADAIYAFGLDMAVLASLALVGRPIRLVYEIGDVRAVQLATGMEGRLVRVLERWVLRRSSEVVVTAAGYATGYLGTYHAFDARRARVIENRMDLPAGRRPVREAREVARPIVIGYFGLLRCRRSWQALKTLARDAAGSVRVLVWGYAMEIDVEREVGECDHIEYRGEFVVPDDLPRMYESVDLVWGCYPAPERMTTGNALWARTNRFYESCYFRRPLVSLAGTDEARVVESWGIGTAVDLSDPDGAARELLDALPGNLARWQAAVDAVPVGACVYTSEHESLAAAIRSVDAERD